LCKAALLAQSPQLPPENSSGIGGYCHQSMI
jgi:hypothetical protein